MYHHVLFFTTKCARTRKGMCNSAYGTGMLAESEAAVPQTPPSTLQMYHCVARREMSLLSEQVSGIAIHRTWLLLLTGWRWWRWGAVVTAAMT